MRLCNLHQKRSEEIGLDAHFQSASICVHLRLINVDHRRVRKSRRQGEQRLRTRHEMWRLKTRGPKRHRTPGACGGVECGYRKGGRSTAVAMKSASIPSIYLDPAIHQNDIGLPTFRARSTNSRNLRSKSRTQSSASASSKCVSDSALSSGSKSATSSAAMKSPAWMPL